MATNCSDLPAHKAVVIQLLSWQGDNDDKGISPPLHAKEQNSRTVVGGHAPHTLFVFVQRRLWSIWLYFSQLQILFNILSQQNLIRNRAMLAAKLWIRHPAKILS